MRARSLPLSLLTLFTAAIHLWLGLAGDHAEPLLALNGLGYLVLLGLWWRTPAWVSPRVVWAAFVLYTLATLVGYFVLDGLEGLEDPLGMFTKGLEMGLLLVLWAERPEPVTSSPV